MLCFSNVSGLQAFFSRHLDTHERHARIHDRLLERRLRGHGAVRHQGDHFAFVKVDRDFLHAVDLQQLLIDFRASERTGNALHPEEDRGMTRLDLAHRRGIRNLPALGKSGNPSPIRNL